VDLIRFCYWVKEFSSLAVDRVIEQATELSAERTFAIHPRFSVLRATFPHLPPLPGLFAQWFSCSSRRR
jgi:hypothetical protein